MESFLFQILEDLIRLGGFLIMPAFIRQGRQLTDREAKTSLEIAVQRVHIEVFILKINNVFY